MAKLKGRTTPDVTPDVTPDPVRRHANALYMHFLRTSKGSYEYAFRQAIQAAEAAEAVWQERRERS